MTGPAVVSIARIDPELARRSWGRVQRLVAGDGLGNAENLQCFIAVFGHGDPLPETIERVRRVLAAGTPDRLRPHIAVQAALSSEPSADTPGTLYVNWLFEPGSPAANECRLFRYRNNRHYSGTRIIPSRLRVDGGSLVVSTC
jgi:hypothetical protein